MKISAVFRALVFVGVAVAVTGCAGQQGAVPENQDGTQTSTIRIGWLGPLTGDIANFGKDSLTTAQMAVEEVNAAGGVQGRDLELIVENGNCSAKEAANAGQKLIDIDTVPVILGGLCSSETLAVAPMAEAKKVVLLSYCSSAPSITNAGDYVFRTFPSDAYEGVASAGYIFDTLNTHDIAVIYGLTDYTQELANAFMTEFKRIGGDVSFVDTYQQDTRDFRTTLIRLKQSDAELLYFVGYPEASVAALKQLKELGITLPVFGISAWEDTTLYEEPIAEGVMYAAAAIGSGDEVWQEKVRARGVENMICSAPTYDTVHMLADVMNRVGTDPEKIKNELYHVQNYEGVTGKISFDSNGDVTTAQYEIKQVNDKQPVVIHK